jgi:hypothetical protein
VAAPGDRVSSTESTTAASWAIEQTLELLAEYGIEATRDAGAFYPQPVGVLVGLPTLEGRTLGGWLFTIPISVVSGDPLNATMPVDRLYALADDVAIAIDTDTYRPTSFRSGVNAEPLPAIELVATCKVDTIPSTESEVSP